MTAAIFTYAARGLEVAALALLLYGIYSVIFNLYFHPLRNFPGPRLTAASKIPYIINRCRGLQVKWTKSLHDQYGDVVRLAPDQLSFTSAEAWKDIYGHASGKTGKTGMSKDWKYYGPDLVGSNGLTRANDEDHSRQRRALAHAFSDKALTEQQPIFRKHVDILIDRLGQVGSSPSGATDMTHMFNYCLFDITGELVFGAELGLLQEQKYRPWVAAVLGAVKTFSLLPSINATYPWFGGILRRYFVPPSLMEKRKLHGVYTRQHVDARLAREADRPDMWSFVLRHTDKEKGLALHEMYAVGGNLMIGGTETSATLLSGLTYFLLTNPDKMDILAKEIRGAFAHPGEIDTLKIAQLPYLRACLQEALRIYPPVAVGMPRMVPPEGKIVSGRVIPGGMTVYVSHYAAYHSHANFYEPDKFMPERWAEERDAKFSKDILSVVEPFSYGPRNCIGRNLAFHQMRLILACMLWHYDLELCPEVKNWDDQLVYNIWQKPPLMCKLHPVVRE